MVRDGYFYGFGFIAAAVLIWLVTASWIWAVVPFLLACFFFWFFRDPQRPVPIEAGLVVSPADGKITEVARIQTPDGERIRLSIFLSVFDVHVNRSPIAGKIACINYKKGEFLAANKAAASQANEQNILTVEGVVGGRRTQVTFNQIAGLIARRIVCYRHVGDIVQAGERVGLIKFGSRVDVLFGPEWEVTVKRGDRVAAGSSVIARMAALQNAEGDPA